MKSHDVFLGLYTTPGRLLALDFGETVGGPLARDRTYARPPRFVVQWGSGIEAWISGFELRRVSGKRSRDEWYRFGVAQGWVHSVTRAARDGGPDLGGCLDFDSDEVRIVPCGPGLAPLATWLRAEAQRLKDENAAKAKQAATIQPLGGCYTAEQQEQLAALRYDETLPIHVGNLGSSFGRLAVLGAWLAQARRKLVHGGEIVDLFDEHRVGYSGPADTDTLVYVASSLGLVKRYDYDPQPGQYHATSHGALTPKQQEAWRRHGRLPNDFEPSRPIGSQFWYYSAGPRLVELPIYSL